MPRNKSEKLPSCPQAWSYLRHAEASLNQLLPSDSEQLAAHAWQQIPIEVRNRIGIRRKDYLAPADARQFNVEFIREHYAP